MAELRCENPVWLLTSGTVTGQSILSPGAVPSSPVQGRAEGA